MNLHNVDLNKLAVFCQVVDSGGYRLASDVLNVSPSALSQTIQSLEQSLGFSLFHRVGRKMIPTQNGQRLHRDFTASHGQFLRRLRTLADTQNTVNGLLHVGAYLEFAKARLAPALGEFLRRHPQARIKFVFDTPSRLHRLLERGKLDLCFSIYPSQQPGSIASTPVFHEELVLVAPAGQLPERPSFEEVLAQPMIEYYLNHQPIRRWLDLHFRKRPRQIPIRAYAATAEMVLALIREGLGVGVLPQYLLETADLERLTVVRPTPKRCMDHLWLLESHAADKSALHTAFTEHVREHLRGARG